MDSIKLLKELTETPGPSGFEDRIAKVVQGLWEPLSDTVTVDRMGSVQATKFGQGQEPNRTIMLAAHLDEIGLMVKQIVNHKGNGFLRLTNLGGVDVRHLYGQTVVVHGKRELVGVIGALPSRMLPQDRSSKAYGFKDLVVDVGLSEEDVAELVSVGDAISFRQPMRTMQKRYVTGKALDNRASVAAVTHCLEYLQGRQHDWDVLAVATAQEETRLLGAFTTAHAKQPDAAIAIDVTFGKGAGLGDSPLILGGGPAIDTSPAVHPGVKKALYDTAQAIEMKVADTAYPYPGGTDAYGLQIARAGVPTGLVSIPLRYMHTMVETVHADDVERVGRLLGEFIARLDENFLDDLAKGMMED
jgi:endoglucanase